jgi:hypothetical protein
MIHVHMLKRILQAHGKSSLLILFKSFVVMKMKCFLRQYVQEEDFEDFYVDVSNCDEYVAPKAIMKKVARNLKRLTL